MKYNDMPALWFPPLTYYKEKGAIDFEKMEQELAKIYPYSQGVLIPGKSGILEDTCYKRCFSALKKAGKNVYRNCHCLPPLRLHRTALPASPHSDSIRSRTDVR